MIPNQEKLKKIKGKCFHCKGPTEVFVSELPDRRGGWLSVFSILVSCQPCNRGLEHLVTVNLSLKSPK